MGTWNGDAHFAAIQRKTAEGLLVAAVRFEQVHKGLISVPNPPPYLESSKPGEYMRLRTGDGLKGCTHYPETWQEVVKTGWVRVGFGVSVLYMLSLELRQKRLGLLATLERMRPQLAALATAAFKRT